MAKVKRSKPLGQHSIETSKGIVYYEDMAHLEKRVQHEVKWLFTLVKKEQDTEKHGKFVKELIDAVTFVD